MHRLVSVEPLRPEPAKCLPDDFHARGELALYDDVKAAWSRALESFARIRL